MDIDRNILFSTYQELSTEELLRLHGEGTLTEQAYDVLETELKSRNVDIPPRLKVREVLSTQRPASTSGSRLGNWLVGVSVVLILFSLVDFSRLGATAPQFDPTNEITFLKHFWTSLLLVLVLSFVVKTGVIALSRWGTPKQCVLAGSTAYFGSVFGFILIFLILTDAQGREAVQTGGWRDLLAAIFYFQQVMPFLFWYPIAIIIEGIILSAMKGKIPGRQPWHTVLFANLWDFGARLIATIPLWP